MPYRTTVHREIATEEASRALSEEDDNRARGGEEANGLPTALRHPMRREILRRLHACGGQRDVAGLAEELDTELPRASYHVRVLETKGCLRLAKVTRHGGATKRRYESAVEGNAAVEVILNETKEDDAHTLAQERAEQADRKR
jgi:hypothetical protein